MKESKFNMKIKNSMRYHGIRTLDDQPGNFATPKKYNRSRSPLPQTITYTQNCFDYLNIAYKDCFFSYRKTTDLEF